MNSDPLSEGGPFAGETGHGAHVPVPFRRESFRAFDRRMDQQLARLVARWIHTAAPAALRPATGRPKRRPR